MSGLSKPAKVADNAIEKAKREATGPKPMTKRLPVDGSRKTQTMFNTKELDENAQQEGGERKHAATMPIGS